MPRPICLIIILLSICSLAMAQQTPSTGETFAPVQKVDFAGNTVVSSDSLRSAVNLPTGTTLSPPMLTESIRRIEDAYTRAGYIGAVSYYEFRDTPAPRTIIFNIIETKISEVRFNGLKQTKEGALRRLIDTKAGKVYSTKTVQTDITRLYQTKIFDDAKAELEPGVRNDQVAVVFTMKEAKTRRVELNGSVAPQGDLVLQLQYTEANLGGSLKKLSAAVDVGTLENQLGGSISYVDPLFNRRDTSLSAKVFSDFFFRFDEDLLISPSIGRYFERRSGLETYISRDYSTTNQITYGIRFEDVRLTDLPIGYMTTTLSSNASVIVPSLRYTQDRRVILAIPASGSYISGFIEPEIVDFSHGGTNSAGRIQGEWRQYIPLKHLTPEEISAENPAPVSNLALRLNAGTSVGSLPFSEQYFIGGINNLRGYRESRFWGKDFTTLNTELRYPFNRQLIGLLFVDAGDAWNSPYQFNPSVVTHYDQHNSFSPRTGGGVGVWYVTQFGVLRLEFAKGETYKFHFAVGGNF